MSLPKLNYSEHKIKQPSTGELIKVKPWTMKEQQPLYVALESNSIADIFLSIQNIVKSCITEEDFDTSQLTTFDTEYLFVKLRAKSVGENLEFKIKCDNCEETHYMPAEVNLNEVEIIGLKSDGNEVQLNDQVSVKMKYPTFDSLLQSGQKFQAGSKVSNFDLALETLIQSIDAIKTEDSIYKASDTSYEDLKEFVLSANEEQMKKLLGYVNNFPTIYAKIKSTCDKCEKEQEREIKGILDFFR